MDQPPAWGASHNRPVEELEQVPWTVLSQPATPPWRRWAWLIAGALVTATLAAVVARAVWRPQPESLEVVVAPDESPAATDQVPAVASSTPPPTVTDVETSGSAEGTDPLAWAEADLRADAGGQLTAVARAEWLVTALFTDDGAPGAGAEIRRLLPRGLAMPSLPHDHPGPSSYVEWARATNVEPVGQAVRVEVLLRRLVSTGEDAWRRLPVEAVAVMVDAEGRILDLPSPVAVRSSRTATGEVEEAPPPREMRTAALQAAGEWGKRPRMTGAWQAGSFWRLAVEVEDDAGAVWPMILWFDAEGNPTTPP